MVRELAARIMEIASETRMKDIKQRWRDVNAMRRPDRPPVWCNPVGCWPELLPESMIVCRTPELRQMEIYFKRLLIKYEIDDDTPVNPFYDLSPVIEVTPANIWGIDIRQEKLDAAGSAWRYLPALNTPEDFDRLVVPHYRYDREATTARYETGRDILDGIMPVRMNPFGPYFSVGTICWGAAMLRGLEPLMLDMIDAPELVHRLMQTMTDGVMNQLDCLETSGLVFPNINSAMLLSDPLRDNPAGPYTLQDCWIHGNSQEFDQVGPAMFEEFLLNYQKSIFSRFGAVCYGCCENLTRKLDMVLAIPNLRLLSCSAWTDLPLLVQKAGERCCIMWRHKASDVVCSSDTAALSRQIFEQAEILKGCSYQVILRELQTLMGHDDRLREWTLISKEAVSR